MGNAEVLHLKLKHPSSEKASFDRIDSAELKPTYLPDPKRATEDTGIQRATAADKKEWDELLKTYTAMNAFPKDRAGVRFAS